MRMNKGKPFMHVKEEAPMPDLDESQRDNERARREGRKIPVFSEVFLYPRIGKGDARFVLGVAEEYEHVIEALGPSAVRAILDVTPRLVQRLGTGAKVAEWLADARSERDADFEKRFPPQVILDDSAAEGIWRILHESYSTFFAPENDMDKDAVRAYHLLTDALGEHEKSERKKEQDRLPEKLAKKANRTAELEAKRARQTQLRNARLAVAAALRGEGDKQKALEMYDEAYGTL